MIHRSKKYLEFIRSRPCVVTGATHNVVAHHVRMLGGGGMGLKPSDYQTLPLHYEEHEKLHRMGERSFFQSYQMSDSIVENEIRMKLLLFLTTIEFDTDKLQDFVASFDPSLE